MPGDSSGGMGRGLDPQCIFRKYFKSLLTVQKQGVSGKSRMALGLGGTGGWKNEVCTHSHHPYLPAGIGGYGWGGVGMGRGEPGCEGRAGVQAY